MPEFNSDDLRQRLEALRNVGQSQQPQQSGAMYGSSNPFMQASTPDPNLATNFSNLYRQVAEQQQQRLEQQRQQRQQERTDATFLDQIGAGLLKGAEMSFNLGGAQDRFQQTKDEGLTPRNMLNFGATLPGGIMGAPMEGLGYIYQGATGRDIQSMDENGQILAEQLSTDRRAWDIVNGGIDIFGLGTGGSARVLGAAGRAIAPKIGGKGEELINKVMPAGGRGFIANATEGKGKAARVAGFGGQLASDAAVEGTEEFIQAFADAGGSAEGITDDTFGQAIDAAKWGALGGAMMGAAGGGVQLGMDLRNDGRTVNDSLKADMTGDDTPLPPDLVDPDHSKRTLIPTAQSYIESTTKSATKSEGSFALLAAPATSDIGIDEGHIGANGLKAQWLASGEDLRKHFADMFEMTVDQLNSILTKPTLDKNDYDMLNQALEHGREKNRVAIERNPATNKTTVHDIYITKIIPGDTLQLHWGTSQLGGGDLDGDMKSVMHLPYKSKLPSELFIDPSSGETNFDYKFFPDLDIDEARNELLARVAPIVQRYVLDQDQAQRFINAIVEHGSKVKNNKDSGRIFAQTMNDLVNQINREHGDVNPEFASYAVGKIMSSFRETAVDTKVMINLLKNNHEYIADSVKALSKDVEDRIEQNGRGKDTKRRRQIRGTIGRSTSLNRIQSWLGQVSSIVEGTNKDASFRTGATTKYTIAKFVVQSLNESNIAQYLGDTNGYVIARILKLTDMGEDMNENIIALYNTFVADEFIRKLNGRKIGNPPNGISTDDAIEIFIEARNKYSKIFNQSIIKEMTNGSSLAVSFIEKPELSADDNSRAIAEMSHVMAQYTVDEFFDIPPDDIVHNGMLIGPALLRTERFGMRESLVRELGEDASKLWKSMVRLNADNRKRANDEMLEMLNSMHYLTMDDLGKIDNYDSEMWIAEATMSLADGRVSVSQNLAEVTAIENSWAREMMFFEEKNGRANVLTIAVLDDQYAVVRDQLKIFEEAKSETERNTALEAAKYFASINRDGSILRQEIFDEICKVDREGNPAPVTSLLDMLTSKTTPYDDKQSMLDKIYDDNGLAHDPLLITVLQPEASIDGIGTVKARIIDAGKAADLAEGSYVKSCAADVKAFEDYIGTLSDNADGTIMTVVSDYCLNNAYEVNVEVLASMIYDAKNDDLHNAEKGTGNPTSGMNAQQIAMIVDGGAKSFLTKMQESTGVMSLPDILTNRKLFAEIFFKGKVINNVYDPSTGKIDPGPIDRDWIFKKMVGREPASVNGDQLSVRDFLDFLKKNPTMIRMFEPHKMVPVFKRDNDGSVRQQMVEVSTGSLADKLKEHNSKINHQNYSNEYVRQREINNLLTHLINENDFYMLVSSVLASDVEGSLSLSDIKKSIQNSAELIYNLLGERGGEYARLISDEMVQDALSKIPEELRRTSSINPDRLDEIMEGLGSGQSVTFQFGSFLEEAYINLEEDFSKWKRYGVSADKASEYHERYKELHRSVAKSVFKDFEDFIGANDAAADVDAAVIATYGLDGVRGKLKAQVLRRFQSVQDYQLEDAVQFVSDMYDEVFRNVLEMKPLHERLSMLIMPQDLGSTEDMRKKAIKLSKDPRYATVDLTEEWIDDKLSAISKASGAIRENLIKDFQIRVNNHMSASGLRTLSQYTQGHVNLSAVGDVMMVASGLRRLVSRYNARIDVPATQRETEYNKIPVPKIRVADPGTAYVTEMSTRLSFEQPIGPGIGIAGSVMVSKSKGLSLIPHDHSCNGKPIKKTWGNIKDNLTEYDQVKAEIVVNGKTEVRRLSDRIARDSYEDDVEVILYDKRSCTDPVCRDHYGKTRSSNTHGYITPLWSYQSFLDVMQEDMFLKLKKSVDLTAIKQIFPEIYNLTMASRTMKDISGKSRDDIREDALQMSNDVATRMADSYHKVIEAYAATNETEDIDIESMARMCSTLFLVTGENGQRSYMTLFELNDDKMCDEVEEKIGSFVSIESIPMTFEMISSKIEHDLCDAFRGQREFDVDDVSRVAWKAKTEWRNVGMDITRNDILSSVGSYNIGGMSNVLPSGAATGQQLFLQATTGSGALVPQSPSSKKGKQGNDPGEDLKKFTEEILELEDDDSRILITNVSINEGYKEAINKKINELSSPEYRHYVGYSSAAVVIEKEDVMRAAMKGEGDFAGYNYIITLADIADTLGVDCKPIDTKISDDTVIIDLDEIYRKSQAPSRVTFSELIGSSRDLCLVLEDYENLYGLGDAGMYALLQTIMNIGRNNESMIKIDGSKILNGPYQPEVVKRSDMASVARKILDDEKLLLGTNIKDKTLNENIMDAAMKWLEDIAANGASDSIYHEDGFKQKNISMYEPFAIVKQKGSNMEDRYMIAVSNGNVPLMINEVIGFQIIGDQILFQQVTPLSMTAEQGNSRKSTAEYEAGKSQMMIVPSEVEAKLPKQDALLPKNMNMVVDNRNTVAGRRSGREDHIAKVSAYYAMHCTVSNIGWRMDDEGFIDINPDLWIAADPSNADPRQVTASDFDKLFPSGLRGGEQGNDPLWKELGNGKKMFFKPGDYRNSIVARFVRDVMADDDLAVSLANIFAPYDSNMSMTKFLESKNLRQDPQITLTEKEVMVLEVQGLFRNISFAEMECMFSGINPKVVWNPFGDEEWRSGSTLISPSGEMRMVNNGTDSVYLPATIRKLKYFENESEVGEPTTNVSHGMQQRYRRGLTVGAGGADSVLIVKQILASGGDITSFIGDRTVEDDQMERETIISTIDASDKTLIDNVTLKDYGKKQYIKSRADKAKTFDDLRVELYEGDEKVSYDSERFKRAHRAFKNSIGSDSASENSHVTELMFMNVVKVMWAWSYENNEGSNRIPITFVEKVPNLLLAKNDENGVPIFIQGGAVATDSNRVTLGRLPYPEAEALWMSLPEKSKLRMAYDGDFNKWADSMYRQQQEAYKYAGSIVTTTKGKKGQDLIAKKKNIEEFGESIDLTWSRDIPMNSLIHRIDSQDNVMNLMLLTHNLIPDLELSEEDLREIVEQSEEALAKAKARIARVNKRRQATYSLQGETSGSVTASIDQTKNPAQKALDGMSALSMFMGVLDPGIAYGSFVEGTTRGFVQEAAMGMNFGPWSKEERTLPDGLVEVIAQDERFQSFLRAVREVEHQGRLDEFILGIQAGKDFETIIDEMYTGSQLAIIKDKVFGFMSQDRAFIKRQCRLVLKIFDTYATQAGYKQLLTKTKAEDGKQITMMEAALANDPVRFFVDGLSVMSPYREDIVRAFNTSNKFSMAHENCVSLLISELMKRSSVANFGITFLATGFVRYVTNMSGRVMNWFVPMSAINYVVTKKLGGIQKLEGIGLERTQEYNSLRAAFMVDCAKMPMAAVVAIIIALGLLQPPDDDDLRGNYEEWLIGGRRISEDFVFADLTGPIIPYACYMKSWMEGKPRMDLLIDGLASVMEKNPMMKVGEVIDTLLSPDVLEEQMVDEADKYTAAFGGEPVSTEMFDVHMGAAGLSFLGKLVTPTFLKNLGRSYGIERSYKKVWAPGTGMTDVENGIGVLNDTENVSYEEALMRKVTRDNPVIGTFMNLITGADTSWNAATHLFATHEMPAVILKDQTMLDIRNSLSISYLDEETGEYVEKPEEEKQKIAMQIIATLQASDNMEDLYKQGFVYDSYTRQYVGEYIWQMVDNMRKIYTDWKNSDEADVYVLGNGDYQTGARIRDEYRQQMNDAAKYWENFYYDKLNSEPMKRGVQQYVRENVTFAQDDNGDTYATGIPKGMSLARYITGMKVAPGTMTNPEGTMGYYGNWETPSVIDGLSAGGRAMIPIDPEVEKTVPFDSIEDAVKEKNRNYQSSSDSEGSTSSKSSSSKSSPSYSRRSGGRSGGGGGGGSKTIYSRPGNVNLTSPRTISTSRPYDSKLDYLRPGFETKGSREASRRSDF